MTVNDLINELRRLSRTGYGDKKVAYFNFATLEYKEIRELEKVNPEGPENQSEDNIIILLC